MSDDAPELPREKRRRLEPTATDPTASEWSSPRSSGSLKSDGGSHDSPRTPRRAGSPEVFDTVESFLKRSAPPMKSFADNYVAGESRRRGSQVAVFLALRTPIIDPQDFTIFVYRGLHLVHSQAFPVGSKHGRLLFIPPDSSGGYNGSYTLIAGTRAVSRPGTPGNFVGAGGQELSFPFANPAGVAARTRPSLNSPWPLGWIFD